MFLKNQYPGTTIVLDGIFLKHGDVAYYPDSRMDDPYFAAVVKRYNMRKVEGPATVDINGPIVQAVAEDVPEEADVTESAAKKGRAKK